MGKRTVTARTLRAELKVAMQQWGWSPSEVVQLLQKSGSRGKGSGYERDVCKQLSLWWTGGERDDVFWRSSGSGARATVRGRKGTATAGQYGDVAATDPIGKPFTDMFTVEVKRGYNDHTIQDLLDCPDDAAIQVWEGFLAQAWGSHKQAGSYAWMLVIKRDRREALVCIPWYAMLSLTKHGAFGGGWPRRWVRTRAYVRNASGAPQAHQVVCLPFADWLAGTPPGAVKATAKAVKAIARAVLNARY